MTLAVLSYPKFRSVIPATNLPNELGKVYTYATGTTDPLATYADAGSITINANPVILDPNGEAPIFIQNTDNVAYDIIVKDRYGTTVDTMINIQSVAIVNGSIVFAGDLQINNNSIVDANLKRYAKFTSAPNAANYLTIGNSATGVDPSITVTGSDTNRGFNLVLKGTGAFTTGKITVTSGTITTLTSTTATITTANITTGSITTPTLGGLTYPTSDSTALDILATDGAGHVGFYTLGSVPADYASAGDISIGGGTNGQSLHTHGSGNLYWDNDGGSGTIQQQPYVAVFSATFQESPYGTVTLAGDAYNVSGVVKNADGDFTLTLISSPPLAVAPGNLSLFVTAVSTNPLVQTTIAYATTTTVRITAHYVKVSTGTTGSFHNLDVSSTVNDGLYRVCGLGGITV